MGKLLKYEMKKTWPAKLITLGLAAVAELVFLGALFLRNSRGSTDEMIGLSILLLTFIAFGGILLIGIQSVLTLHRDMNTKQGYMLYMTPRNSYQILGAKLAENGLSIFLTGAFFFLLGMLDVTLLFSRLGQLEALWETIQNMLAAINAEISLDTGAVLCLMINLLTSWLATVSIAYLADIICAALLNGKKFNGFVSFLFFIALSMLLGWIQGLFRFEGVAVNSVMLIQSGIALVYAAVMYFVSAWIMDRFLSV